MALNRLYFITMERGTMGPLDGGTMGPLDGGTMGPLDGGMMGPLAQVEMACRAGIRLIQLRMKEASDAEFLEVAAAAKETCDRWGSVLIINDRVEVAVAVDADGVHVGREDMPVREARRLMGEGKIVGGTANTLEDIREHYLGGADYIGLGPYRYTATKKKLSAILGLEGYQRVMRALKAEEMGIPVMAIGGIGLDDVGPLLGTGVYGVAFSGLLVRAADRAGLVRELEGEVERVIGEEVKNIKTI
jgi:thiamine-phosphate diphosphorylase